MHRNPFLQSLDLYKQAWPQERATLERLREFVVGNPNCFSRENLAGHVTGSCLIVTPDLGSVLLTYHGKLDKWLQLGGHCDGDPDVFASARREGLEESGLVALTPYSTALFDIDIHQIPARKQEPEHFHYDARYLFVASEPTQIQISLESKDLKWFRISDACGITSEPSMHRQFDKLRLITAPTQ